MKDLLDEDEVVTAKDYEIETGSVFDVKSDYTGLEIKDADKVKVTFEEAKNDKDEDLRQIMRTLTKRSIMWNR